MGSSASQSAIAGDAVRQPVLDRLTVIAARCHAQRVLNRFLAAANRAIDTQQRVLTAKILRNADSAFGRDHHFAGIRSYGDFVCRVPISPYDYLQPYVERVKRGECSAMFGRNQKVLMFAKTSGTTDMPKYVPVTTSFLNEYRQGWNAFGIKALVDHPGCFLRPIVQVISPMDEEHAECGLPCGAITGLMAQNQKRLVRKYYVVPREAAYVSDATARYYAVMRFALPANVAFLITASPATQLKLARTADRHASLLIRDIHDGSLTREIDVPPAVRPALEARLRPDPATAAHLETILSRTGRLLPKHYWRLGFLANWTGGTMSLYLRDFPEYFGDVPVRDIGLLASEGRMTIPIEDGTAAGILDVVGNFYEFIPAEEYGSTRPTVLRAHELALGGEYFILLTNSAGFYRYDIGDRVIVRGFFGQAPVIEFLHKGLHAMSLTGEKLTERQVVIAFERTAGAFQLDGCNFVLAPHWGDPPRYRLHLEAGDADEESLCRFAVSLDEAIGAVNVEYASKRRSDRLATLELNLLPPGWLSERDISESARHRPANEQFKHQFLLNTLGGDRMFPTRLARVEGPTAAAQA